MPDIPIVLASTSPRRRELLRQIVPEFQVFPPYVDEEALTVEDPWETARVLALAKAESVARERPSSLVIGSDTVVAIETAAGRYDQLAKPANETDAHRMLALLAGRCHVVVTGVAIVANGWTRVADDTTTVCFRHLDEDEIRAYVDTGEPMDKAGAYAIQGGAAGFVESTKGSLENVIGLPVGLLAMLLLEYRSRHHRGG